jgi:hypothetical protein
VGAVGIENVVAPIGVEDGSVGFTVLAIRGFSIVRLENREEIGEKIDQHGGTIGKRAGVSKGSATGQRGSECRTGVLAGTPVHCSRFHSPVAQ